MTQTDTAQTADILALATDIESWLRDRLSESGAKRFVLGLSGGIDSALVCGLAVRAVGSDKVLGIIMPSSSVSADAELASDVAGTFGVQTITIDLTEPTNALKGVLSSVEDVLATSEVLHNVEPTTLDLDAHEGATPGQLAEANLKPRLRMTTNYYIANLCGGVVLGTGNKTEAMIGYFTKYGDGGVDLLPIVDLYKHEVREMARVIGVPDTVIQRPPSAGLWEGQTDEDEIGLTYEELDATLLAIASGNTENSNPATLEKVRSMVAGSQHKRAPVPAFRRG
ncbi:MAG: NAD(+) synthase [Chloroflexota bacterium]|nr:NAD(+) synthase [Chloroflexota bacterium]